MPDDLRTDVVTMLADVVASLCLDHPTRVAIDGRSTSGKTTFANALADTIRACDREVLRASIGLGTHGGHSAMSGRRRPVSRRATTTRLSRTCCCPLAPAEADDVAPPSLTPITMSSGPRSGRR